MLHVVKSVFGENGQEECLYGIHDVTRIVNGYADIEPARIVGDSVEDLKKEVDEMAEAFNRPEITVEL